MKEKLIFILFLFVLGCPMSKLFSQESDGNFMASRLEGVVKQQETSSYPMNSYDIALDYNYNEFNANKKYKNKVFGMIGISMATSTDMDGNPFMLLASEKDIPGIEILFKPTKYILNKLSEVTTLTVVKIKAKCLGLKTIMGKSGEPIHVITFDGIDFGIIPPDMLKGN